MKNFYEIKPDYCCLNLVRAVESGYLDEVVSGIFFRNQEGHCKDGVPRVLFCPFCGGEIITEKTDTSWRWKVVARAKGLIN